MKYKDYYEVLGLERTATQEDIKRSYRKLARKYHPDVSEYKDAEDRFKELTEAYEVLQDPEKRAAYDSLGKNWRNGQDFQPPPNWDEGFEFRGPGSETDGQDNLGEFFEAMFGSARRGYSQARPSSAMRRDHHVKIVIDLEDTYRGAERSIALQMPVVDEQGHVRLQSRTLNISIPKGIRAGQHLRLAGQGGSETEGGPAGDLFVEIAFREHPRFHVDGRDVSLNLPVAPWEAALGARVRIPTPDGVVELAIPANSAGGRRLRLKGKGIPGNPAGDFYVVLNIVLPPANDATTRAAYDAMKQAFNFDPRAHLR